MLSLAVVPVDVDTTERHKGKERRKIGEEDDVQLVIEIFPPPLRHQTSLPRRWTIENYDDAVVVSVVEKRTIADRRPVIACPSVDVTELDPW